MALSLIFLEAVLAKRQIIYTYGYASSIFTCLGTM